MRAISTEELNRIIGLHGKWLRGEEGGEQANLRRANLSSANLSSADLRKILINNTVGNSREIKSMHLEGEFSITYSAEFIAFGCTQMNLKDWLEMKGHSSDFWDKYREILIKLIEISPATVAPTNS